MKSFSDALVAEKLQCSVESIDKLSKQWPGLNDSSSEGTNVVGLSEAPSSSPGKDASENADSCAPKAPSEVTFAVIEHTGGADACSAAYGLDFYGPVGCETAARSVSVTSLQAVVCDFPERLVTDLSIVRKCTTFLIAGRGAKQYIITNSDICAASAKLILFGLQPYFPSWSIVSSVHVVCQWVFVSVYAHLVLYAAQAGCFR